MMYGSPELWHALMRRLADIAREFLRAQVAAGASAVQLFDLFAPRSVIETETVRVLAEGRSARGHIFNLGHGVRPETDPDVLTRLTDLVHTTTREEAHGHRF